MTEFEQGVLYGFPLSAIQAFAGLIDQSHEKLSPATSYLAGVLSKDFVQDEVAYYELWWERLREMSPKIVSQAEKEYNMRLGL